MARHHLTLKQQTFQRHRATRGLSVRAELLFNKDVLEGGGHTEHLVQLYHVFFLVRMTLTLSALETLFATMRYINWHLHLHLLSLHLLVEAVFDNAKIVGNYTQWSKCH